MGLCAYVTFFLCMEVSLDAFYAYVIFYVYVCVKGMCLCFVCI